MTRHNQEPSPSPPPLASLVFGWPPDLTLRSRHPRVYLVFGFDFQVKLTSRDPSPPPVEYVRGGGGIFKDMAVHDLDMSRFLMGSEPKVRECS